MADRNRNTRSNGAERFDGPGEVSGRITNVAALTATMAMLGEGFNRDFAVDLLEAVRPHLEGALMIQVRDLRAEVARLQDELARLQG